MIAFSYHRSVMRFHSPRGARGETLPPGVSTCRGDNPGPFHAAVVGSYRVAASVRQLAGRQLTEGRDTPMSRAAVVVNPTKLDDDEAFRKSVRRMMDDNGWDEPLWLETTLEDPGRGQARVGGVRRG